MNQVTAESGERLTEALFVSDIRPNVVDEWEGRARPHRDREPRGGHQAEQPRSLESHSLAPGIRTGDDQSLDTVFQFQTNRNALLTQEWVAGHAHVGNGVILGGMTGVHQFCKIGSYAMTSGCSLVLKDIPAYVMVSGNPASARSMNFEGMRRRGWSKDVVSSLRQAYKVVYRQGLTLEQALAELEAMEPSDALQIFIDSLKASERGITR